MIIHEINDLSNDHVVDLLKAELSKIDNESYRSNYHPDYIEVSGNLFNALREGRYYSGKYYVIEENGNLMASSGYYAYTDEIALILTRTYTAPKARHKHYLGKYLIPAMIEQTQSYAKVWATVNEYNKRWYDWMSDSRNQAKSTLFDGPDYMKPWSKFKPIGKQMVNYVEQYVLELDKIL